jgi:hypothetical protein
LFFHFSMNCFKILATFEIQKKIIFEHVQNLNVFQNWTVFKF